MDTNSIIWLSIMGGAAWITMGVFLTRFAVINRSIWANPMDTKDMMETPYTLSGILVLLWPILVILGIFLICKNLVKFLGWIVVRGMNTDRT